MERRRRKSDDVHPTCRAAWTEERGGTVWCDPLKHADVPETQRRNGLCECYEDQGTDLRKLYDNCNANPRDVSLVKTPRTKEEADGLCNYLLLLYCYILNCHCPMSKLPPSPLFLSATVLQQNMPLNHPPILLALLFSAVGSSSRPNQTLPRRR